MTAMSLGILSLLGCLCYGLFKYQTTSPSRKARKYDISVKNPSLHPKKTMLKFPLKSTNSSSPETSDKQKRKQKFGSGSSEAQNEIPETENNPVMPSDGMVEIKIDER